MRWTELKEKVKTHGLRNSLMIAIAPTATIASIAGCYECIEPQVSNLFKRETLSGDFVQINKYLVQELKKQNLWTDEIRTKIKLSEGSIQNIEEFSDELKEIYRTAWEIPMKSLISIKRRNKNMTTEKTNIRFGVIAMMILTAAFCRLIPHPANFAPIGAMALFGAAHYKSKWAAFGIPLLALWLSDLAVNNILYASYYKTFTLFHSGFYWIYGTIALTTLAGFFLLKKVNIFTVAGSGFIASLMFFIITNFGVFPGNPLYTQDFSGLMACYAAGIPFFGGTLAGNLFYSTILFGGFALAQKQFPVLRPATAY